VEHFPDQKKGGVDIPIPQVKIGSNFRTSEAEFARCVKGRKLVYLLNVRKDGYGKGLDGS
jgi:hypothetical protein